MNDEIVEEVRRIRKTLCEEAKELTHEQRREKAHSASHWVQQQIAERRAQCGVTTKDTTKHEGFVGK